MLQRAASNAYSWWASSHTRNKQSKWLEQSLQDMQEKVHSVIKLIEEDGDSFAKRAEMYYKKRPELINFVEESYCAYRALAERYDHLSKELQTANNTIATIFPEHIQLAIEEEDEHGAPKMPKDFTQIPPSGTNIPNTPIKDLKGLLPTASKQSQGKKKSSKSEDANNDVPKSGLSESKAVEEIDKLQKDILALQTVKEFIKSSCQSGLEKFRGIENEIIEKQEKICKLEDEFGEGRVIEDAEACTLMAEAALQSCQEMLAQLEEKQDIYTQEAREEFKKIEDACNKLKSFRHKYLGNQIAEKEESGKIASGYNIPIQEVSTETVSDKVKDQNDLTVSQLAEKIDELVSKVVSLETTVASQTLLIERLRTEANDLQTQVQSLEDKAAQTADTYNLKIRVTAIEAKLQSLENLNKDVVNNNNSLRTHFVEARTSLDHLSDKLSSVKPDEELDGTDSSPHEVTTLVEVKLKEEPVNQKDLLPSSCEGARNLSTKKTEDKEFSKEQGSSRVASDRDGEVTKMTKKHVTFLEPTPSGKADEKVSAPSGNSVYATQTQKDAEKDDKLNWQQMLLSGLEDKDDILLNEYTTILRNYKEVRKKLSDMEKKDRDNEFKLTLQLRELKCAIGKRDEEIQNLRLKLSLLQQGNASENKELKEEKWQASDTSCDLPQTKEKDTPIVENDEEDIKVILVDQRASVSPVVGKLRTNTDAILDENLGLWLRFSSAFNQIQKFKTTVHDLQCEISKLRDKEMQGNIPRLDMKSEIKPIYKHMKEIQNELTLWLEQTSSLKDELERRFSAMCNIQEDITKALKEGVVEADEIEFSSHQAAKFQGEVLNMKQENNKVREELEAGVRRVTTLQEDLEKTVTQIDREFGLTGNQSQLMQSVTRSRIPLHSFIFGTKPKKEKRSVFSRIYLRRKY